ncbi:MFP1 attachment factor 1-like [Malania oleifera]|uniref:MFP1 attachment factor 1-like n=1 Tax=Malania oleifera TaxID=397392 RepID=UPI0025AE5931|nr:MFP1 attachment factor 1-like [Malania oleifera]
MAEAEEPQRQQHRDPAPQNDFSFSIWPPSERARKAIIDHVVKTLSAPSVLSKRYGSISPDEAAITARLIEEEAFSYAAQGVSAGGDGGIEILQAYSKEISKRMIEAVKSKAASGSDAPSSAAPAASEAFSSVDAESS